MTNDKNPRRWTHSVNKWGWKGVSHMQIEQIVLKRLHMPLKEPFVTSFGRIDKKDFIVVCIHGEGHIGYAESVALADPTYTEETTDTVWMMLHQFLIPRLLDMRQSIASPEDVDELFAPIRRHYMAKSALEGAVWDLYCKQQGMSLAQALKGTRTEIEVGVSIGLKPTIKQLLEQINVGQEEGYKRFKIKVKPGADVQIIKAVREHFGYDLPLMVDANSAYTLNDSEHLKRMDDYGLMMIEQPLGHDDIVDHAKLQSELHTPICLDESIHSLESARQAIELGSCQIINIKIGRVGGISAAKNIHDLCQKHGLPVWCGGMLEAGIGRAHNIALASLGQFTLPGDLSASNKYWQEDIIVPEVVLSAPGILSVPKGAGIGYDINNEVLNQYLVQEKRYQTP